MKIGGQRVTLTTVEPIERRLTTLRPHRAEFERHGLQTTGREPLHVYCKGCGMEIDPLKTVGQPRGWWLCPRGCNAAVH